MTSNLKRFGLKHLSHSNLDLARNDLGLWVMRYLYKVYDPANAAMARGNAAEHGCYVALTGGEFDDPVDAAVKDFNKRTALGVNGEARDRERKNIPGFIEQFIEAALIFPAWASPILVLKMQSLISKQQTVCLRQSVRPIADKVRSINELRAIAA